MRSVNFLPAYRVVARQRLRRMRWWAATIAVSLVLGGLVATRCEGEAHANDYWTYGDPQRRAVTALEDIAVTLNEILREMRREKGR